MRWRDIVLIIVLAFFGLVLFMAFAWDVSKCHQSGGAMVEGVLTFECVQRVNFK